MENDTQNNDDFKVAFAMLKLAKQRKIRSFIAQIEKVEALADQLFKEKSKEFDVGFKVMDKRRKD